MTGHTHVQHGTRWEDLPPDQQAQRLRREWMTLMGCDAAEIVEACALASCVCPAQEQAQLDAARRISGRNAAHHREQ